MFDFETVIHRGEDSEKWRGAKARGELPLWVADMDFPCAPAIQEALEKRVKEQIYGYTTGMDEEYRGIVCDYYRRHFDWTFDPQDIYLTGVWITMPSPCAQSSPHKMEMACTTPPVK